MEQTAPYRKKEIGMKLSVKGEKITSLIFSIISAIVFLIVIYNFFPQFNYYQQSIIVFYSIIIGFIMYHFCWLLIHDDERNWRGLYEGD
jgi:heme O synthase-like polyprenyltransferase